MDLAAVQVAELFKAAIVRLQARHGISGRVPSAVAIGAWVDAVVPPGPEMMIAPVPGAMPYAPDPNAIALLTEPGSEAVARSLLALAGRRPDLSDLQRHELFLAGLVHLVVRRSGLIIAPKRPRIFEWIDQVAPVRRPPSNTAGTSSVEDHRVASDDTVGRHGPLEARAPSRAEHAAAQLEDSARRAVARWAGDPRVTSLVATLRPLFRDRLDELGLEDPDEQAEAALRMLGIGTVLPDGTEEPNLFATWPEERLASARFTALAIRAAVAIFVARLRDQHGVSAIEPVQHVSPDESTPDGLRFGGDHGALLQLLWLNIRIDGRTGTEIAADVPVIGTVGWDRDGSTIILGRRNVTTPDIVAGNILRRSFLELVAATADAIPSDDAPSLQPPEALRAYLKANPPGPADMYGRTRADRYRTPGWSDLAEMHYLARQALHRKRRRGRPKGPYLIQSRAEIELAYRALWLQTGRRPYWSDVAKEIGVDERTLRRARSDFGVDKRPIHKLGE
jgi:hypothetical protein